MKHLSSLFSSTRRLLYQDSASASGFPRNSAPSSLLLLSQVCIAVRNCSCQWRKSRSSCIHRFKCSQFRISASWTISTVSKPVLSFRPVTTKRASAKRVTKSQFSSPTSARVATRRVSSVPSPGCTSWIKIRGTTFCCCELSC